MALRLEDRELVITYQAGDDEAFAELVRKYRPKLLSHARHRLSCAESAEDAVQETFVRALRAMPRFNGNYMVGPWLHRILANVCIDEGNRRRRETEKTERAAVNDPALQPTSSIEAELGLDLDFSDVTDAVEDLSPPYREALQMRFVDELPYDEIAQAAGVSEDNARARVSRARSALRSALRVAAMVPVALVGLLRRGERAASAVAGHGATAGSAAAQSSAAQSSVASAMPLLTEAAPVASRAAAAVANAASTGVPVVAKAAVGLGLATAVITPTVDSPVHKATERVLPDSVVEVLTPLAVEVPAPAAPVVVPAADVSAPVAAATVAAATETAAAPVESDAAPSAAPQAAAASTAEAAAAPAAAAATTAGAAATSAAPAATTADEASASAAVEQQAPSSAAVEGDTAATAQSASPGAGAAASAGSEAEGDAQSAGAQAAEAGAQSAGGSQAADDAEAAAASAPVVTVVATSSVEGAALTFVPAGADRYDVAGTLSLTVATTTTTTTNDGETVETSTMSESVAVVAPSTASLQAVDAAVDSRRFSALLVFAPGDDGKSAEMRLAARGTASGDGSLAMTGFFTAAGTESLPLAERGNLSGALTLDAAGLPASLTITLTQ